MLAGHGFHRFVWPQRRGVPYLNGPIFAGRGEPLAVRAERHAMAHGRVAPEVQDIPTGQWVPQLDRLILNPAGGEAPAKTGGKAGNHSTMSWPVSQHRA